MGLPNSFTNFPGGITSLGIPTFGAGGLLPFIGNYIFVQEVAASILPFGTYGGLGTATQPYNTLEQALAAATSGNNDVIFLIGSVHPLTTIAWSKNNVHLVGLCDPIKRGKRARISVTGSTAYGPLVDVTGNGCMFANFGTFFGWAITGSTSPICWRDTGGRNSYDNVEFMGFGDSTVTTGTANQTGARAFTLNTSTGETTWRNCVFGVDTIVRNATNTTLEIAGAAPRCTLENCDFEADLGASGASSTHLLIGSGGIDRYLNISHCRFMNSIGSGATAMTQCLSVSGSAGGIVLLDRSTGYGFTNWETSASARVYANSPLVTAQDSGIAVAAAP